MKSSVRTCTPLDTLRLYFNSAESRDQLQKKLNDTVGIGSLHHRIKFDHIENKLIVSTG